MISTISHQRDHWYNTYHLTNHWWHVSPKKSIHHLFFSSLPVYMFALEVTATFGYNSVATLVPEFVVMLFTYNEISVEKMFLTFRIL